jgi:transcription elongation factor Elf1
MTKLKERKLLYKATHKYLCPRCEGKTSKQLMLENMFDIPFLVKTKCSVCGYDEGMLVEVPTNEGKP